MPSRIKHGLLISIAVIVLLFTVEYGEGRTFIKYIYDENGNLIERRVQVDDTPPTTTASPPGGTYSTAQSVTLTCNDGTGSGCNKIYYTTDGSTPTTSSRVYSSPIDVPGIMTLKFFAMDVVGNSETVKTEIYIIDPGLCPNSPVRIGGTSYITLQAAYNAAGNGNIIKCRDLRFVENLTVNRNIAVTLEGGYDCGYTTNVGGKTTIKGMITTTVGGGKITIKNFVLEK